MKDEFQPADVTQALFCLDFLKKQIR